MWFCQPGDGGFCGGFAAQLSGTSRFGEKLAARIDWLQSNADFDTETARRHDRITPKNSTSEIRLDDGRAYSVEIIDISLSGAAVIVDVKPKIGSRLKLAGMQGHVTRHLENGIAVEFATRVPIKKIEQVR